MSAVRWCVVLVALAGMLLDALGCTGIFEQPVFGFSTSAADGVALEHGDEARLTAVVPGGPMDAAGFRPGDRVRVVRDDVGTYDRAAGEAAPIVRFASANGRLVAVRRARQSASASWIALAAIGICLSALAIALAVRGWHEAQARRLAIGMAWEALAWIPNLNPIPPIVAINDYVAVAFMGVGMVALVTFATGWRATPAAFARPFRWAAAGLAVVFTGALAGANSFGPAGYHVFVVGLVAWSMCAALIVAGLIVSAWHARGVERRRIGWICVTTAVTFTPWIVFEAGTVLVGQQPQPPLWVVVPTVLWPIGYGYSILRREIVDVGFALNRAAVFAATTALLVGLFGALQWAADQLLVQVVGRHDFLVQLTIAVVVLYIVRALRVQTDALVTRVFFASRERRIAAIRALAAEVDAISTAAAIAPFVVERLQALVGIAAAVYLEDGLGFARAAGTIGRERAAADAPSVVALRASLEPARMEANSELGGAMIFPLAVRGRLRGGLACASPAGDDEFAPDEAAALAALASRIAIARDDLLAQSLHAQTERLAAERDALRDRLAALERENALLERVAGIEGVRRSATSPLAVE